MDMTGINPSTFLLPIWRSDQDHLIWLQKRGVQSFREHKVLDLGCRSGHLCQEAIRLGARSATGIDMENEEQLTAKAEKEGWQFLRIDLDHLQWDKQIAGTKAFTLIFAFDIIEHLQAPYAFLTACHRLLTKGGKLALTTPNVSSWERYLKPKKWSGVRDSQHKTLFCRYSFSFLLKQAGFVIEEISAPLRSLSFLGRMQPNIGGQIYCMAERV